MFRQLIARQAVAARRDIFIIQGLLLACAPASLHRMRRRTRFRRELYDRLNSLTAAAELFRRTDRDEGEVRP